MREAHRVLRRIYENRLDLHFEKRPEGIKTKILFHYTNPFLLSSYPADSPTVENRYPRRILQSEIRRIAISRDSHTETYTHYRCIRRVSSDGTRSPEITMNPNSFGLLVTCLPKRAAPTPQYHASKDKLNHGPSCHPQSRRKPARPL
ncbi:hypothetical protein ALC53_00035 [Atta colombica]|uniref:Uncharacterized protein n=1 Tax=Atta colombica TaxID=520822 RepID=A0A151K288_9HYME|nr:hypothetical protein ALC53_00035 [Atta colombica]